MAITKVSNSGIKTGVLKYDSMLAGNTAYDPTDFDSIATVSGTGSATTLSFTNIPSTYKHLQIRYIGRMNGANTGFPGYIRFNSDTGSNYYWHFLRGRNSTASSGSSGGTATSITIAGFPAANSTANIMGAGVIDILDYANTNKNKVIRNLAGTDQNQIFDDSYIWLLSGSWNNTNAITSIDIISDGSGREWTSATRFALYGVN